MTRLFLSRNIVDGNGRAGSALAPDVIRAAVRELGCTFFMDYGMTECSGHICISLIQQAETKSPGGALAHRTAEERLQLSGWSGRPFRGMGVRVVTTQPPIGAAVSDDAAGGGTAALAAAAVEDVPQDGISVGEVIVRGDTVWLAGRKAVGVYRGLGSNR
jgi:acyl-CoA synthetase (AMP-forming)/AMP-acid ligase II